MGCTGFELRNEVYTRKPKTSYSKMKKIYGDHPEYFHQKGQIFRIGLFSIQLLTFY